MSQQYSTNVSVVTPAMQAFIDQHPDILSAITRIPPSTRYPVPEEAPAGAVLKPAYHEVMSTDLAVLQDFIARFVLAQ
jgi:hypothetical protein